MSDRIDKQEIEDNVRAIVEILYEKFVKLERRIEHFESKEEERRATGGHEA